jgi:hypothetical protein
MDLAWPCLFSEDGTGRRKLHWLLATLRQTAFIVAAPDDLQQRF